MPHEVLRLKAKQRLALICIWFLPMMWTVNLVIARKAPGVIGPHVLAIGRWALAGLILGMLARNELWANRRLIVQQAGRYGVLGALGMWICGAWVYLAGQSTSVLNISLIYASSPVMIGVASVVWLGEKFSKRQIAGVAFAILGLVHVVVQGEWAKLANVHLVPGDLWILAAAIAWSAYALLQKIWPTELSSTAQLAAICMGA